MEGTVTRRKLQAEILKQHKIFSPLSLMIVLNNIGLGIHGETLKELEPFLIENYKTEKFSAGLLSVNSLWLNGYQVNESFAQKTKLETFKTSNSDDINAWVSKATNGMIKEIVQGKSEMFLVNALYFKCSWEKPFEKIPEIRPFNGLSKTSLIFMMLAKKEFKYYKDDQVEAVILPFKEKYAAVISISESLEKYHKSCSFSFLKSLKPLFGKVIIPKFIVESPLMDLTSILKSHGINRIFSEEIEQTISICQVHFDEIFQKVKIIVNEQGCEAAAATGGRERGFVESPKLEFRMLVDKPFRFSIYHTIYEQEIFSAVIENLPDVNAVDEINQDD